MSIEFGSRSMSVYRSINQMGSPICVSVEFDSEDVEIGRQGILVLSIICVKLTCECEIDRCVE